MAGRQDFPYAEAGAALSPYAAFDRVDSIPFNHHTLSMSLNESMNQIIQMEALHNTNTRRPALSRRPSTEDQRRYCPRWRRSCFHKYSVWNSTVLWAAWAAILAATGVMLVVGFAFRPHTTRLGIHLACFAPLGNATTIYQDNFPSTHAVVSALVVLGTSVVVACVSLYVAIQCSFSKQNVLANPTNSNLTSAFVLPCYGMIWYTLLVLAIAQVAIVAASDTSFFNSHRSTSCAIFEFPSMWMRHLLPLLMLQKSVSRDAVRRAIALSGLLTAAVLSVLFMDNSAPTVFAAYPLALILLCAFGKFVLHTRASFDYYFYFFVVSSMLNMVPAILWLTTAAQGSIPNVAITASIASDAVDGFTIAAIMLSLRADTMYWLGLDHNTSKTNDPAKLYLRLIADQGMVSSFSTRTSVYDVHYLIEKFKKSMVDVSSLTLDAVVAQGSTAVVLRGSMQHTLRDPAPVAIKMYTTLFVTDDELHRFSKETSFNVQLSHPNIVRFFGLCVVPPSICLVFEYCDHGSLESILQCQKFDATAAWDMRTKLKACLDACRAVAYLHSFHPPLLHRDIKTANYLLSSTDGLVKLSDFGESNLLRPKNDGTMTIVGTVDFMAPEMILGGNAKSAVYGTAADVYSLAITLWHILVPGEAPWHGHSHFDVYTEIIHGHRPRLPPDLPSGCVDLLECAWAATPHEREPIESLVKRVLHLYVPFTQPSYGGGGGQRSSSKRSSTSRSRVPSFLSRHSFLSPPSMSASSSSSSSTPPCEI
ncbi:Aste57867_23414 [Aphanomyces stellatus]|uniref:Aste57867_23414 protein n=1 Tax=Aphanomyces stellatus TaxID=120398 RepID=A0A485LPI0_9STRA|nr:hypothetical protein As57867_023343 [Aphanomyces stellatus]VFU00060.1 Aste57867_23414 [Aphanomyces stellatus]